MLGKLPLIPEPSFFDVETANEKLKTCKSPNTIQAELFQAGVEHYVLDPQTY
jgi:hypothetical protein